MEVLVVEMIESTSCGAATEGPPDEPSSASANDAVTSKADALVRLQYYVMLLSNCITQ